MRRAYSFLILLSIIFTIAISTATHGSSVVASSSSESLVITEKFEITSSVQNVLQQTYVSTVTGKVKNIGDNTLSNVKIIVNVKTKTLNNTGAIELTISSIAPNESKSINRTANTTENFEEVVSIMASVSGGSVFAMGNVVHSQPLGFGETFSAIVIVLVLAFLVLVFLFGRRLRRSRQKTNVIHEVREVSNVYNVTNVSQKQKEEIELEQSRLALENERLRLEKEKHSHVMESTKPIFCQYCGAKNNRDSGNCQKCGATLD